MSMEKSISSLPSPQEPDDQPPERDRNNNDTIANDDCTAVLDQPSHETGGGQHFYTNEINDTNTSITLSKSQSTLEINATNTTSLLTDPGASPGENIQFPLPTTDSKTNEQQPPLQVYGNRSIEIFFGSLKTFHTFYQMLCEKGVGTPGDSTGNRKTRVKPDSIKKLVLVGHPMQSFSGLNLFVKLVEGNNYLYRIYLHT